MKTLKELLIKLEACSDAREWANDMTIEQAVGQCHRGDWLLWLAKKIDIDLQVLTLAKGHCANTVRHLMRDERSIAAVDMAIAYGEGLATLKELNDAAAAAYAAAAYVADAYVADAYVADAAAAAYAAAAYVAAAYVADADAYAYDAAYAAAYAADANMLKTADICRKYIGQMIIDKVNEMLN